MDGFQDNPARYGRTDPDRPPLRHAYVMVERWAKAAEIATQIGIPPSGRPASPPTLKNVGTLERAAAIANHASARTTRFYDRPSDEVNLNEIERILI